jgi:hypothetical protein
MVSSMRRPICTHGFARKFGVVFVPVEGGAKVPHPPEARARALELAASVGPKQAADELDLSVDTVKSWMKRQAARTHRELARQNLVMPVRAGQPWPERRKQLLGALAELAEESVSAARLAVQEGRSKAASEFNNVAARSLTQAQLLGGEPTSRSESRSLALHMQSEGLEAVQREGRQIVQARERQLAAGDDDEDNDG